ncbi:YvrJ family protein [Clostridium fallax]|uniref:YvrJ protein family protein n=1 Tax=Clostridium fallax TaxID=1533 RepID=A0A1M4Z846_9CLOT|nr:YvrJ family protein [Clostridium fallax]SHF14184.1 YvrJ protein family protein [Clostridium fallax]SQB07495.1 membrane-associated protein [Clostridium fallax]
MYDQLVSLISTVGFPIAVSIYLLIRMESKLDVLSKEISSLINDIAVAIKQQREE